ncbi:MAG: type 2 isopentenyl-diphosphate Delta-isomerase [Alphaproteobacteria bacterium]
MGQGTGRPRRSAAGSDEIAERKQAHLDLCLREDVEALRKTTLLEEVELLHDAVPDLSLEEIDCTTTWLGKRLRAPLVITAMTGGTGSAFEVNRDLAGLAEEFGIAFGVGSQRAMQKRPGSGWTFEVRRFAPTTVLLANIGLAQARTMEIRDFEELVEALDADAICVHLNVAQELVQPEGDRDFRDGTSTFRRLVRRLGVPVVAKETGCGISRGVATRLRSAGVRHVDVSGAGGTSWVRIEALRDAGAAAIGGPLRDWGIPTAASILGVRDLGLTVVASGGIRDGLDVARSIALGASLAGVALPVYQAYRAGGVAGARTFLRGLVDGLRAAMLLTGSRRLADLRRAPAVLGPRLRVWDEVNRGRRGSVRRRS